MLAWMLRLGFVLVTSYAFYLLVEKLAHRAARRAGAALQAAP